MSWLQAIATNAKSSKQCFTNTQITACAPEIRKMRGCFGQIFHPASRHSLSLYGFSAEKLLAKHGK
jgi:hypothetical protein